MKIRRLSAWAFPLAVLSALSATLTACGTHFQFANRTVAPSCIAFGNGHDAAVCHRALVAIRNADSGGGGALQILDAANDQHQSHNGRTLVFPIGGYAGRVPSFLLNFPEEQQGFVYNAGNGAVDRINYTTEVATPGVTSGGTANANSLAISSDGRYLYAAQQQSNLFVVTDGNQGITEQLKLPNVYRVAANPSGTVALAFVQNSNSVYRVLRLESNQQPPAGFTDCEPANLPRYCLLPVPGNFDRPAGAYFSLDGSTAFVLNSGPENGGASASISSIPTATITTTTFPIGTITSPVAATVPLPGGATVALSDGTTLYVAGSQLQPDGLFAGRLSVIDIASQAVTATYNISDGTHGVMRFADDNTLWIGSTLCATGELNKGLLQPASGCLTLFNRSSNAVLIEPYLGDLTGIADIVGFHKIYVAQGGQVYRYNTPDGANLPASTIFVGGTAIDVSYMDAASNTQD